MSDELSLAETMGLSAPVLRGIKRKGYQLPTPIQRKTLPLALSGQDVVGMARTGSGKTAAFVVPMLERCADSSPAARHSVCLLQLGWRQQCYLPAPSGQALWRRSVVAPAPLLHPMGNP